MREEAVVVLRLDTGDLPAKSQQAAQSLQKVGTTGETSARQTAAAMRQLPAQLTDVATQLAGGQNPLLILLQQGGQVKDSFGGIGPAIRGIGAAINPVTLGIGAVAAAVSTLALAAYKSAQQEEQLRDSLLLTGNAAGLTAGRLQLLADQTAAATRQTVGSSRDIVMALAASGQVSNKVLDSTAKAVALVADVSGEDAKKISADFASMSSGVAKWAAEHNKAWNFISVEQYRYIKALEEQGKAEEAMIFVNQRLSDRLADQARNLGLLEKLWDGVRGVASGAWDAMLGLGRENTTRQQLDIALERLSAMGDNLKPKAKEALEQRIQFLKEQLKLEAQAADARSRNAQTNRVAIADEREKEGAAPKKQQDQMGPLTFDQMFPAADVAAIRRFQADNQDAARQFLEMERESFAAIDAGARAAADAEAKRLDSREAYLQDLKDAVAKASLEQIEDEKQRGEALIQLDLQIAKRRLQAKGLGTGATDEATRLLEEKAAYDTRALGRETGDNTYNDVRGALSAAFRDSKNPAKAFAAALGEAVYTRLTASMADALATAAVGKSGSGGGWGEFLNYLGSLNGGLTVDTGGMGTNNTGTSLPTRGGSAMGTNYVPRTMVVKVHEGEAIVPRKYSPAAGGREPGAWVGSAPPMVSNYFSVPPGQSPAAYAAAMADAVRQSEAKLLADAARPGRPMNNAIRAGA